MKRPSTKGPIARPSRAPIIIRTSDIAQYCHLTDSAIRNRIIRDSLRIRTENIWDNFWNLVSFLESKGLRPVDK